MTTYRESAAVAHVMHHVGNGRWLAWCGRDSAAFDFDKYWDGRIWDPSDRVLRHLEYDGAPTKPWCEHCKKRVAELAAAVLGA